jgi:hypothetical protein
MENTFRPLGIAISFQTGMARWHVANNPTDAIECRMTIKRGKILSGVSIEAADSAADGGSEDRVWGGTYAQ